MVRLKRTPVYVMDALPGFKAISNLPNGFEKFLTSRPVLLALFGKAVLVTHEENRQYLAPYERHYPDLSKSVMYVPGSGSLEQRITSQRLYKSFPIGCDVYTTYPGNNFKGWSSNLGWRRRLVGYDRRFPESSSLHKGVLYPQWGKPTSPLVSALGNLCIPAGFVVPKGDVCLAAEAWAHVHAEFGSVVVKPATDTGNGDGVIVGATKEESCAAVQKNDILVTQCVRIASTQTLTGKSTEMSLSVRALKGRVLPEVSLQIVHNGQWAGCFVPEHDQWSAPLTSAVVAVIKQQCQTIVDLLQLKLLCNFDAAIGPDGTFSILDYNFRASGSHAPLEAAKGVLRAGEPMLYEPIVLEGTLEQALESLRSAGVLLGADGRGVLPLILPCGYHKAYVGGERALAWYRQMARRPLAI